MKASAIFSLTVLTGGVAACVPQARHDFSTIPQRQITFDDMCHLQDYFDQRNAAHAPEFRSEDESSTETQRMEPDERGHNRRVMLGEGTYIVADERAKTELRRLLRDDYVQLPTMHLGRDEGDVRVHVGWWASGEMRRLRPDMDIQIATSHETVDLPFDPCVGEFLFGAPIYALRRHVFESDRARANGEIPPVEGAAVDADAGVTTSEPAAGDAGAASDAGGAVPAATGAADGGAGI